MILTNISYAYLPVVALISVGACRACDRMVVGITLPVQSVPITTKVVSSNSVHGEARSILHYDIQVFSDLQQVGDCKHHKSNLISVFK